MRLAIISFLCVIGINQFANSNESSVPTDDDIVEMSLDEIASLNLLGSNTLQTHIHRKGEFMIRYMYMFMSMDSIYSGSKTVSEDKALDQFMVTPLSMDSTKHMVMPMYGITNRLSVMMMMPYYQKSMNHKTRMGVEFETKSKGLGDIEVIFDYAASGINVSNDDKNVSLDPIRLIVSGGWSHPTGSIDKRGDTPAGSDLLLPYPMQLGSGTFDLLIGATLLYDLEKWNLSAEFLGSLPLGRNKEGYSVGNHIELVLDGDYQLNDSSSLSGMLKFSKFGDYDGVDNRLDPNSMPTVATKRPDLRSGERLDIGLRYNYLFSLSKSNIEEIRLYGEFTKPIYQFLDSYNLGMSWMIHLGGSYTF